MKAWSSANVTATIRTTHVAFESCRRFVNDYQLVYSTDSQSFASIYTKIQKTGLLRQQMGSIKLKILLFAEILIFIGSNSAEDDKMCIGQCRQDYFECLDVCRISRVHPKFCGTRCHENLLDCLEGQCGADPAYVPMPLV
ncbi:hypothetical protein CLF_111064 [Clonorchis sinensis]|uniref:Uncharacterized protein n=1 Tax=Clonorchis sinensis TaxID=79923 RepID=G7YUA2_CLOSI|nr:hypothetical protein CLF_111064 [Clonorchis sinensis]